MSMMGKATVGLLILGVIGLIAEATKKPSEVKEPPRGPTARETLAAKFTPRELEVFYTTDEAFNKVQSAVDLEYIGREPVEREGAYISRKPGVLVAMAQQFNMPASEVNELWHRVFDVLHEGGWRTAESRSKGAPRKPAASDPNLQLRPANQ